jgi:hypothetical protein
MDGPIGQKGPKIEPAGDLEPEKPLDEPLPPSDKLTSDIASDFFEGFDIFQEPTEQYKTVEINYYNPSLPVSTRYAKRTMEHLNEGLDKAYEEEMGVLSESGAILMNNKDDVDVNKKVGTGQVVFKHVGNAVILIFPQKLRDDIRSEGVERYKALMTENLKQRGKPLVPIQVLTLQTKDWQEHIPKFFEKMQTFLPEGKPKEVSQQKTPGQIEQKATSFKAQAAPKRAAANVHGAALQHQKKDIRKALPERTEEAINKIAQALIKLGAVFEKGRKALTEIKWRHTTQELQKSQKRQEDVKG